MELKIKTNVKGLDELKELLEVARRQSIDLQETLDKISQSEIKIGFETTHHEQR